MKSPMVCPLLIHYSPKARKHPQLDAKLHWNAVTSDHLTKSPAQAQGDSKACQELPAGERPTFHEIRALGARLYEQQGFEQEYIQSLMGHADAGKTVIEAAKEMGMEAKRASADDRHGWIYRPTELKKQAMAKSSADIQRDKRAKEKALLEQRSLIVSKALDDALKVLGERHNFEIAPISACRSTACACFWSAPEARRRSTCSCISVSTFQPHRSSTLTLVSGARL
jgi:hypothetical protein